MAASLKGQLGLRSSPLAPTSSKLTTQWLVLDHMNNHYHKLNKAKAAIDNGPPKSLSSSQKVRDRKSRKTIEKYGSRPASSMSHIHFKDDSLYDESQWDEPEDEEERQVREIMRTTLRVPLKTTQHGSAGAIRGSNTESQGADLTLKPNSARLRQTVQAVNSAHYMSRTHPLSARSATSLVSNISQTSCVSNPLKVTYSGDVLEKHCNSFTEPKDFTPRTLKSNRESHLKRIGNKYYTPPRKMQVTSHDRVMVSEGDDKVFVDPGADKQNQFMTQAKSRSQQKEKSVQLGATETLTETMLMDMSLQSHDARQSQGNANAVPPLAISMDKDHLTWLKDQASKAQIRAHSLSATSDTGNQQFQNGHQVRRGENEIGLTDSVNFNDSLRFTRTGSLSKSFGVKSPTSLRLGQADLEQKYVTFAQEVTQDIISRGICSDSVLHRVFDSHIERKKEELDERRLRAILIDIRRELGVKYVSPEREFKHEDTSTINNHLSINETTNVDFQKTDNNFELHNHDTLSPSSSNLEPVDTFQFGSTKDVFSTIHSQDANELTVTQTLQQYQLNLYDRDEDENSAADRDHSSSHFSENDADQHQASVSHGSDAAERAKQDQNFEAGSKFNEETLQTKTVLPAPRPRRLLRQNASTTGHDVNDNELASHDTASESEGSPLQHHLGSQQPSIADTDGEVEEEYENDYDADEDDGQDMINQGASDDDF